MKKIRHGIVLQGMVNRLYHSPNYFQKVYASDISQKQLAEAPLKDNIEYVLCPAEGTPFPANIFDLITVSQAYHWLNWKKFQEEATRVGKSNCIVAVWMYDLLSSKDEQLNELILHFYKNITGPYWDLERQHVEDHYTNLLFDFKPLPSKQFIIHTNFTKEELLGYFSTWSATQNFIKVNGFSPIEQIEKDIDRLWLQSESKSFQFPVVLKLGRITK